MSLLFVTVNTDDKNWLNFGLCKDKFLQLQIFSYFWSKGDLNFSISIINKCSKLKLRIIEYNLI